VYQYPPLLWRLRHHDSVDADATVAMKYYYYSATRAATRAVTRAVEDAQP
jgi:hypothetical protein